MAPAVSFQRVRSFGLVCCGAVGGHQETLTNGSSAPPYRHIYAPVAPDVEPPKNKPAVVVAIQSTARTDRRVSRVADASMVTPARLAEHRLPRR